MKNRNTLQASAIDFDTIELRFTRTWAKSRGREDDVRRLDAELAKTPAQ